MTAARPEHEVVLRDTLFVPGAIRLPRRPTPASPDEGAREAEDPCKQLQAAAQVEGFRCGREEGLRTGYEEGLQRGVDAAREEAMAAVERAVQAARAPLEEKSRRLDALLGAMASAAQDAWAGADEDVLALCYETLCRIVGEAACSPDSVRLQVQRLLAASDLQGEITVHLHPADVRLLDEALAGGQLPDAHDLKLRWRADPRVVLGGCMLAGKGGGIDARLETVLAQCKAGLLQSRAARAAARAGLEAAP